MVFFWGGGEGDSYIFIIKISNIAEKSIKIRVIHFPATQNIYILLNILSWVPLHIVFIFLLLHNKFPKPWQLKTTQSYYPTVSVGEGFGPRLTGSSA